MKLENWSIVCRYDPYRAPELQSSILRGNVFGDPRFEDGARIDISAIDCIDRDEIVTCSGRRFQLGTVDPEYEKAFPNAKQRLLDSLAKRG